MKSRAPILPFISFVISTHNRREELLHTLGKLREVDRRCQLVTETHVVDNASHDGTAAAVAAQFPTVRLHRLKRNRGACAKNLALPYTAGRFILFLDDDSYPTASSLVRMLGHFTASPSLGAAVFDVQLPGGRHECSAYPKVFIGCGTAFRREALDEVGGLPSDFFMQAEEYDLSLRLLESGWDIRRFDDLHVLHRKTPAARQPARTTRLDARNNLTLVARRFPREWVRPFAIDWMRRYHWMAADKGMRHRVAFWAGFAQGVVRSTRHRQPVSLRTFERFAMLRQIEQRMRQAVRAGGLRSILLVDVGKNILPFQLAAAACDVRVVAVADDRFAKAGRRYRGVPVLSDAAAAQLDFNAAVIANVSPVHAAARRDQWRALLRRPVLDLFEEPELLQIAA